MPFDYVEIWYGNIWDVKSSRNSFKGKWFPFSSVTQSGLCVRAGGPALPWAQQRGVRGITAASAALCPWWWLLFLLIFSLKSLTFGILGLLNLQSVLPWLRPTPHPGTVQSGAVGRGVESKTRALPFPQGQPEGSDKNKDDLSMLASSFYIQELHELILLIFLPMSVLSQLGTMCPSE